MAALDDIREYHDDLTAWRRDIHAHPELGFEEQRTSDLVAEKLAGFGIEVAPELAPRLLPYAGRDITMGIRPEDLRVANGSDPAGLCFDAVVEVVERLGSETLLDLQVGAQTMVAAVEPAIRAQHGDKLRLALRADRLHFFDMKSEAAV